jgi:hypothetical protein
MIQAYQSFTAGFIPPPPPPGSPGDARTNQLISGVKGGAINKQEFNRLEQFHEKTETLKGKYEADGNISRKEQKKLNKREAKYDKMYQKYQYGDYHPRTKAGSSVAKGQKAASGSIYDGLKDGTLTRWEGNALLKQQDSIAYQKGQLKSDGHFGRNDKAVINNQLGYANGSINNFKNNYSTDWAPTLPPQFFAQYQAGIMIS